MFPRALQEMRCRKTRSHLLRAVPSAETCMKEEENRAPLSLAAKSEKIDALHIDLAFFSLPEVRTKKKKRKKKKRKYRPAVQDSGLGILGIFGEIGLASPGFIPRWQKRRVEADS